MNETRLNRVAQLGAFLEGTLKVKFQPIGNDVERYGFVTGVLGRFVYGQLGRADKGVLMHYLTRITGYSRALDAVRLCPLWRCPLCAARHALGGSPV